MGLQHMTAASSCHRSSPLFSIIISPYLFHHCSAIISFIIHITHQSVDMLFIHRRASSYHSYHIVHLHHLCSSLALFAHHFTPVHHHSHLSHFSSSRASSLSSSTLFIILLFSLHSSLNIAEHVSCSLMMMDELHTQHHAMMRNDIANAYQAKQHRPESLAGKGFQGSTFLPVSSDVMMRCTCRS